MERAQAYAAEIDAAIARLAEFPETGSPRRHRGHNYRRVRKGSHAILYRLTRSEIVIVRILHVRMQASRHIV